MFISQPFFFSGMPKLFKRSITLSIKRPLNIMSYTFTPIVMNDKLNELLFLLLYIIGIYTAAYPEPCTSIFTLHLMIVNT